MPPRGRLLNFVELRALCFSAENFGDLVPNRWKLIAKYVAENTKYYDKLDRFCIGERTSTIFKPSDQDCRLVFEIVEKSYSSLVDYAKHEKDTLYSSNERDAYKPLVLIPAVRFCCKVRITVRNQPSFAHVYTTDRNCTSSSLPRSM